MELYSQFKLYAYTLFRNSTSEAYTDIRAESRYLKTTGYITVLIDRNLLIADNNTGLATFLHILGQFIAMPFDLQQLVATEISTGSNKKRRTQERIIIYQQLTGCTFHVTCKIKG